MLVVHSPQYHIDLGAHVFPTTKYQLVRRAVQTRGLIGSAEIVHPEPASWDDLARVHTGEYLEKVRCGHLSPTELRELELPWSAEVVEGFRMMVGGTIATSRAALRDGGAVHLGGGFHHAFANHGEGFCLFNDVAVAIRVLQCEHAVDRVAVVDCDVHHGNGTAMLFERDPLVFTCSLHQQHNYPLFKPRGSLDIGLEDGTQDHEYLERLDQALGAVIRFRPALVCYLAGADPYRDDMLGGLALSPDGLRARDRLVLRRVSQAGVPWMITLAGGYARKLSDTVAIHIATVEEAVRVLHGGGRDEAGFTHESAH